MAVTPRWKQGWRIRRESSFGASIVTTYPWNHALGGANGWVDLPVVKGQAGLQPKSTPIYPGVASGQRAMNQALPVAGAYPAALGSMQCVVYPELMDRILYAAFGSQTKTPTAGNAVLTATAVATLATATALGTQSDGTEQLKFTVAGGSTSSTSAVIQIIQDSVVLEEINIGTVGASVDGVYYSQGAYDGSSDAISIKLNGSISGGTPTIAVAGVDYTTTEFTMDNTQDTPPTLQVEQRGRPEAGSGNSEFFNGVVTPTIGFSYDRTAADGLLLATMDFQGLQNDPAAAGSLANAAALYYYPVVGWHAALTIGGANWLETTGLTLNINPTNGLYDVSSGNQNPTGAAAGEIEVTGTFPILPGDESRWDDYRNSTVRDIEITFTTQKKIVDSTGWQFKVEMTQLTFSDYSRTVVNQNGVDLFGADLPFRAIFNTTDSGACKVTTISRMPV